MHLSKKTKIVATIGPSSEEKETLSKMVDAGLSVIRLNFSHGSFAEHQKKVDAWREIANERKESLGILQDLSGPKIRTGTFKEGEITLKEGEQFTLTTDDVEGTDTRVSVNYEHLADDLEIGSIVRIDDGKVTLKVSDISGIDVICDIIVGGTITDRRGVNLPGADLRVSALTEKDKQDLEFGARNDVDFVALSFVRTAADVEELRGLLDKHELDAKIISKIETQQAVDNIDEIIQVSDGIMVARGDLAIEIGPENVPTVQKGIIRKCNVVGKPVITATQMLESMVHHPVPTRAEVSDVANAIFDGTDAIMLSGETTIGEYPVKVVEVMTQVARRVEQEFPDRSREEHREETVEVVDSITRSAVQTAREVGAAAIVALTASGFSARMVSRYKPRQTILGLSPHQKTANWLSLSFGCLPIKTDFFESLDDAMELVRTTCRKHGLVQQGEKVVVVAGLPFAGENKGVDTNTIFVEQI